MELDSFEEELRESEVADSPVDVAEKRDHLRDVVEREEVDGGEVGETGGGDSERFEAEKSAELAAFENDSGFMAMGMWMWWGLREMPMTAEIPIKSASVRERGVTGGMYSCVVISSKEEAGTYEG